MNRICALKLISRPGQRSRLEGRVGDFRIIIQRDDGLRNQWLMIALPVDDAAQSASLTRKTRATEATG